MSIAKDHANYFTATCLEWKPILSENRFKQIVVDSLKFLTDSGRVSVFAFCIMHNHIHLIWQMLGDHKAEEVQRDYFRFTSQQILKILRNEKSVLLDEIIVNARDRKHQVWERNACPCTKTGFYFKNWSTSITTLSWPDIVNIRRTTISPALRFIC